MAEDLIPGAQAGEGPAARGGYNAAGPDYRQLERPAQGVLPYHLHVETGATARALAGVFRDFEAGAGRLENKLQTQAGAEAGAKAGMDPSFQPKTGLASVTAYGSAYDAAAHVSYVNGTHTQIESALTKAEQDNAGDPVAFQAQAQGAMDGLFKEVPPLYKPELMNTAALRIAAGVARTREQAIQTARSDAFESYTSTTDTRIGSALATAATLPPGQQAALVQQTIAGNRTQLDALVKARAITPERSAVLQTDFQNRMTKAVHDQYTTNTVDHMMTLARAGDVDAADRALKGYVSDPENSSADKAAVTKEYLTKADEFNKLQSRVYANDVAKIGQRLVGNEQHPGAYGRGIESQIHGMYRIGAISPEQLHSLLDQSMRNQIQSIKDDSGNALVDAAVHGGPKLDPTNHEQIKAADVYFKTHMAGSNVAPLSDQWVAGVSDFARQTNIVVPSAISQIRVGLISGDSIMAARSAAAGERIRAANQQLDPYDKDPRSAAIANSINSNLRSGIPPQRAYEMAVQAADMPEAQRKIVTAKYTQEVKKDPNGNAKALQSSFDAQVPGFFSHAPAPSVALQAEYEQSVSTFYGLNGGNLQAARDLAVKQMQTTWGMSHMNGAPELVKYPPERLGIAPDALRADVAASLRGAGYGGSSIDVSKYKPDPNDPSLNPANWGRRADGTAKGSGFFGLLKRPDGKVSSEISVGVEMAGKETEIPTMVPTLSQKELDYLIQNPVGPGHPVPRPILDKAVAFARQRLAEGKSPFAQPGEQVTGHPVVDAAQVHLVPNAYTDGSQGRVWSLVHTDPTTGLSDVLLDEKNRPLQYHVPAPPDFAVARQKIIAEKLAAAREERDQNRKTSGEQIMFENQLADQYFGKNPQQRALAGR